MQTLHVILFGIFVSMYTFEEVLIHPLLRLKYPSRFSIPV